jgi:hypothetical protein
MRFIFILLLLISGVAHSQSWTPIAGKQRFTNGLGLPTKDTTMGDISDSSQIILRRADSSLWFKYKSVWQKLGGSGGTVKSVKLTTPTGLTTTGSPITDTGTIAITYSSGYSLPTTASQALWDAAYTNRITTANAPLSITSNTIKIDTTTRFTGVATLGKAYNDSLVLATAIAAKGNGSVTSVATGLGLSGGTITTTGTLLVDTSSTSILSRQRAAATYAPISINGTVTSVARTNGLGISASVANSTTTPNITIAVDTSDASILTRQRASATYLTSSTAAATYLPLTGGTLSSRLTGTSLILNKDSLPTVTGKTWGLVVDTANSNRISRQQVQSVLNGTGLVYSTSGTITYVKSIDSAFKAYTGTINFTASSAPSGTTNNQYCWSQRGTVVTLCLKLNYANTGSGVTQVLLDIPSDMPVPRSMTGYTANDNEIWYMGNANTSNTLSGVNNVLCYIVRGTATATRAQKIQLNHTSNTVSKYTIMLTYFTDN